MSTGLAASTVTPGRTAPEASFTVPATLAAPIPCASARRGSSMRIVINARYLNEAFVISERLLAGMHAACNGAVSRWESSEPLTGKHYRTRGTPFAVLSRLSAARGGVVEPGGSEDVLEAPVPLVAGVLLHVPLRRQIEDGSPRPLEGVRVVNGHLVAHGVGGCA